MTIFYFFQLLWHRIFHTTLQDSMQHALSTPSTYPGSCKTYFLCIPVFGRKSFLMFPIIYLRVSLRSNLYICLSDLVNPLISADIYPGWHNYSLWGLLFQFRSQLALKFHWVKTCLYYELLSTLLTLHLNRSVMPKPVFLMTVQEAHKEYKSLTDQIRAKYKQLDSGKYGAVGTPAFNAEACELANLLAHVSQLCQKLKPATSKGIIQAHIFQALKMLFGSKFIN